MDPQTKTDELITELGTFSYSVDSLQVLAWTELKELNADKEFIKHHKDIIRCQKLTKLDEVSYVLQLVGELNRDQSVEYIRKIEDLEETKKLLEASSKKLREQINYTDNLLEEVVTENEELVKKLQDKGLSDKDFKKQLEQKQLIETKDDTIERLQTALENARRELDIIHKARSPTPSLSEELKIRSGHKHTRIPSVVVTEARDNISYADKEEAQDIRLSEEEASALNLIEAIKNIISNARKAGSRGYTAETKNRKFCDLARYKDQFEELEVAGSLDNNVSIEFKRLISTAQELLERRSPSPRTVQSIEVNMAVRIPALSEITKIVNNTVPTFFGTEGPDLSSEVCRFIQGCKMVERELLVEPNADITQTVLECVKLRLLGSAYSRIAEVKFGTMDALCNQIKKLYLRKKSSDQIREAIISCKQSPRETASKFGERLESLLNEAVTSIYTEWSEENGRNTIIKDFKRIAVRAFIKGLRDQALKARFIGQEREELSSLIEIVEEAEELFSEPQQTIHTVMESTPCSFCNKQGHERLTCRERLNTPYCTSCGSYGHEVGPTCRKNRPEQKSCDFCRAKGHTVSECRKKLASLYCRRCRINGHSENQYCLEQTEQNHLRSRGQTNNGMAFTRSGNSMAMERGPPGIGAQSRNRVPRCYKCNETGHYARECQNNCTPRDVTYTQPNQNPSFPSNSVNSMAIERGPPGIGAQSRNRVPRCYKCNEMGHYARECQSNFTTHDATYTQPNQNPPFNNPLNNNSGNANRASYSQ